MSINDGSEQMMRQPVTISLQRSWPQLGKELFTLEHILTSAPPSGDDVLSTKEKEEQQEKIKDKILAQLYREEEDHPRDLRYCALLVIARGRGGEIVGNPYYRGKDGRQHELPYTGLEGYYAGTRATSTYPGMTPKEIILEEAKLGTELLADIKKQCVQTYSWPRLTRMKKALEGEETDVETLRDINLLWTRAIRRLHVRVYNNKEFESTITERLEQIERLLMNAPQRTGHDKEIQALLQKEYHQIKEEISKMGKQEKEQEKKTRRERERIRRERIHTYIAFRDETYHLLQDTSEQEYTVSVRDARWKDATLIEKIDLPRTRERNEYAPIEVIFTPEHLEGYLFLARLGAIGGDPLTRSVLTSK